MGRSPLSTSTSNSSSGDNKTASSKKSSLRSSKDSKKSSKKLSLRFSTAEKSSDVKKLSFLSKRSSSGLSLARALSEGSLKITVIHTPPDGPGGTHPPEIGSARSEQTVFRDVDGLWKRMPEIQDTIDDPEMRPPNYNMYGPNDGGWL